MSDTLIEAVARAICCSGPCYVVALNERAETAANYEHPWHCPRAQYADKARAAIAAIEAAGYRIVPVEPTEDMAKAMLEANIHPPHQSDGSVSVRAQNAHIYAAMLAAAPKVIP